MDLSLYFDHNATTPLRPEARRAMDEAAGDYAGNPSSQHGFGRRARAALEEARERLAALLKVRAAEVYFTSGGTESNRLAILGSLTDPSAASAGAGAEPQHAVVAALEHASVLEVYEHHMAQGRGELTRIAADASGRISAEAVALAVRPTTRVVSVQAANNETGAVQPVEEVVRLLRAMHPLARTPGPLLHVDMVQSFGKLAVAPGNLGADLAAISSHKIGGPMGAGALWVRPGTSFRPSVRGGPQERRMRPGTEALPAIAGMVKAAELAVAEAASTSRERACERLGDYLAQRAGERIVGVRRNGGPDGLLPNTANLAFDGVDAELLVIRLDGEGVAVSMGSACASGSREPSHVLRAMGVDEARIRSSVRFSTGWTTRREHVDRLIEILVHVVGELRERSTLTSPASRR